MSQVGRGEGQRSLLLSGLYGARFPYLSPLWGWGLYILTLLSACPLKGDNKSRLDENEVHGEERGLQEVEKGELSVGWGSQGRLLEEVATS